ncbi:MAG: plasminogen-binding N-terminal domain-containing protein [Sulfuricurvum sp.]|nr:plasminogen-binding N-terminal domain-containing protein [Sulfuricurvum sp.]
MMRIWLITLISFGVLNASSITTPLLQVENNHAAVIADNLHQGMSGFILRQFDTTHSTIISSAIVEQVNPSNKHAILKLSPYDGLRQNSLPSGQWSPKSSDTAVLGYDYERALLIAPNDDTYDTITKSMQGIEWIHPDNYATYLSYEGHPTPLVKDFQEYCTANSIGLLYIQSAQTLFTLDCKSFTLLEFTPSLVKEETSMTPFYTRVPKIRAAWWGEGSSRLDKFEPYYLEQIALKNPKNQGLYELYKGKFSDKSALLRNFDLKE